MQLVYGTYEKIKDQLDTQYNRENWVPFDGLDDLALDKKIRDIYESMKEQNVPFPVIKATLVAYALENCRIHVSNFDLFANICHHPKEIIKIRNERACQVPKGKMDPSHFQDDRSIVEGLYFAHVDFSHTTPDWDNILTLGIPGLLARAEDKLAKEYSPFIHSVVIVYKAFLTFANRFAAVAESIGNSKLSEDLFALTLNGPKTLRQALELGLLYREIQEIEGEPLRSMGIFDRQYKSFYENDIAKGRLTSLEAEELLCIYFSRFHAESQGKLMGTPFCFGGLDKNGEDICCQLTTLSWNAFKRVGKVDPKFSIRVNNQTPDSLLNQIVECIKSNKNAVLFANEELAKKMFLRHGKEPEDLANFVPVGCYEPAIMGKELSCTMAGWYNFAKVVELVFLEDDFLPQNFEEFFARYLTLMKISLAEMMSRVNEWELLWNEINPAPLLSGTMDECIASLLDVSSYGTKYSTSGIMCAGIGTATDSLAAVQDLVFNRKIVTYSNLKEILKNNWQDAESLRLEAKYRSPKWGQGDHIADDIAQKIVDTCGKMISQTPNVKGGFFQMGLWSIDKIVYFGLRTGATPNGRLAKEVISKNVSSTIGCDNRGLSGLIASVTKLDHTLFGNGTVLDVMLPHKTVAGKEGTSFLINIVRGFFAQGGLFIHFNILDANELKDAQKNPQNYQNLQIRLCGWNVRFIDLDASMQDCLIREAEGRR